MIRRDFCILCFPPIASPVPTPTKSLPLRVLCNASVSGWRFLSYYRVMYYRVLYYCVDMDFVLSGSSINWAFIIPETAFYYCLNRFFSLRFQLIRHHPRKFFSHFNRFPRRSCYENIIIWNAIIYILHELLANRTNFFAERCREHHHLFAVWCAAEDFLHVFTHICE